MEVHNLNAIAADVWQLCDGQTSPTQMAEKLQAVWNTPHAEELVWLTLARLEKANLLQDKVVSLAGARKISRRDLLKGLGVAVALLPVISSIVAPGPVEAESPTSTPPPCGIVIYDAGGLYDGDLGGRTGADLICQSSPTRPGGYSNYRAFISVNDTDEIRDMPANYGVPTNVCIGGRNGVKVADNWNDLLDGDIDASLVAAGSGNSQSDEWWSGCASGSGDVAAANCLDWTCDTVCEVGTVGSDGSVTVTWIIVSTTVLCSDRKAIKCIAY
jgi:hypothetical protein